MNCVRISESDYETLHTQVRDISNVFKEKQLNCVRISKSDDHDPAYTGMRD